LGVLVVLEATRLVRGAGTALPAAARWGGVLLLAAIGVLVVTGTLATAAGPHPGSTLVRRIGSFQPSVSLHVRATAAFGIVFLLLAVWAWRDGRRYPCVPWVFEGLLALVVFHLAVCV